MKKGNRKEILKIANTLMRKKLELKGKRIYEQDNNLLINIKNILFSELAIALNTTSEAIDKKIISLIAESMIDSNYSELGKDVKK